MGYMIGDHVTYHRAMKVNIRVRKLCHECAPERNQSSETCLRWRRIVPDFRGSDGERTNADTASLLSIDWTRRAMFRPTTQFVR